MKFWGLTDICHTLFEYIKKYFYAQNKPKEKKIQKIETKKKIIKSKPRRGLYKFDPNQISDSSEQSKVIKIAKIKKISKKQKFLPKINFRENFKPEVQSTKTKQTFFNISGDQISSISDNEQSDSFITVKQFLVTLQPSIQTSVNLVNRLKSLRDQQQEQQQQESMSLIRMPKKMNKSILRKQMSNIMRRTTRIPIYQAQKQQTRQNQQSTRHKTVQKPIQGPLQRPLQGSIHEPSQKSVQVQIKRVVQGPLQGPPFPQRTFN